MVAPYNYEVTPVEVTGSLHLKTGCTYLGRDTCLVNPDWADRAPLKDFTLINVSDIEPWAANILLVRDQLVMATGYPRTQEIIERAGFPVRTLDISELAKAEAGLTCLSLVFGEAG
jgi:dimethylargininase